MDQRNNNKIIIFLISELTSPYRTLKSLRYLINDYRDYTFGRKELIYEDAMKYVKQYDYKNKNNEKYYPYQDNIKALNDIRSIVENSKFLKKELNILNRIDLLYNNPKSYFYKYNNIEKNILRNYSPIVIKSAQDKMAVNLFFTIILNEDIFIDQFKMYELFTINHTHKLILSKLNYKTLPWERFYIYNNPVPYQQKIDDEFDKLTSSSEFRSLPRSIQTNRIKIFEMNNNLDDPFGVNYNDFEEGNDPPDPYPSTVPISEVFDESSNIASPRESNRNIDPSLILSRPPRSPRSSTPPPRYRPRN